MTKKKTNTMESEEERLKKARFLFELALKSDEVLQKANERLNDKIKGFMTISATLIPIVVGLGYYILKQTTASWVLFPFLLSLGSLVLSIVIGVIIQRPSGFRFLNPRKFMKKFEKKPLVYVINKSASTWSDIVAKNKRVINSKELWLDAMLSSVCCGLVVLVITFALLGL
jgi:hypothetical protein